MLELFAEVEGELRLKTGLNEQIDSLGLVVKLNAG